MITDKARGWALPAGVALGGFAAVRLICWATCLLFG
jgi:hypothetical protein